MEELPREFPDDDQLARPYDAAAAFLSDYMDARGGAIKIWEYGMFMYAMFLQMRQTMTPEELAGYTGNVLLTAERALHKARDDGELVTIAEDWRDKEGGEELRDMISEGLTDEDLQALLNTEEE